MKNIICSLITATIVILIPFFYSILYKERISRENGKKLLTGIIYAIACCFILQNPLINFSQYYLFKNSSYLCLVCKIIIITVTTYFVLMYMKKKQNDDEFKTAVFAYATTYIILFYDLDIAKIASMAITYAAGGYQSLTSVELLAVETFLSGMGIMAYLLTVLGAWVMFVTIVNIATTKEYFILLTFAIAIYEITNISYVFAIGLAVILSVYLFLKKSRS